MQEADLNGLSLSLSSCSCCLLSRDGDAVVAAVDDGTVVFVWTADDDEETVDAKLGSFLRASSMYLTTTLWVIP